MSAIPIDLRLFDWTFLWGKGPQSRPIEIRAKILYLANKWMDFKMHWMSERFLDLAVLSLLAFPGILQFIAQFWSICPISCIYLPDSHSHRNESSGRVGRIEEREEGRKIHPPVAELSCNPKSEQKHAVRASCNKMGNDFYWKRRHICKNNSLLCLRMADIRIPHSYEKLLFL